MRIKRFSEHKIIQVLKQVESGRSIPDVWRENDVRQGTNYDWKSQYRGMEASDVRKITDLETDNQCRSKCKRTFL
jgi:putative transposase